MSAASPQSEAANCEAFFWEPQLVIFGHDGKLDAVGPSKEFISSHTFSAAKSTEDKDAVCEHESQLDTFPVEGLDFWTDTWGSFFELKGQNTLKLDSKKELSSKDCDLTDSSSKKGGAVLSQPLRASLFPGDSQVVTNVSHELENIETSRETLSAHEEASSSVTNIERDTKAVDSNIKENSNEQQSSLVTTDFQSNYPCSVGNGNEMSEKFDNKLKESDEFVCDNQPSETSKTVNSSVASDLIRVPEDELFSESCKNECTETSKSLLEESCIFSEKTSEHEGSSDKYFSDSAEPTSESIQSSASNIMTSSQNFLYDNNNFSSRNDFSHCNADINVNWEWDHVSSDMYALAENSYARGEDDLNLHEACKLENSNTSFNTDEINSFPESDIWVKKGKSFITVPQSTTNEEQISHSDGSSNSSKDFDDTDTTEVKEYDAKSSSSSSSHTTSSCSFVKFAVEGNDNIMHRGQSPVSVTTSERSDITKHESEQNTSGDENETATSSDIEILSPPNGENDDRNASPLKHIWLSRPFRVRRSESPPSDSSKESLMPVVREMEEANSGVENILPDAFHSNNGQKSLGHRSYGEDDQYKKCQRLQQVLQEKEKKIDELNKEIIELQENEQRLKNLVQKMRIEQTKESKDIAALTKEFTLRLALVEKQLQDANKERDSLHIQLEEAKIEIARRISAADIEEVIKEKDQQIMELTEEGKKLSKKELQQSTLIKKLRAKEEEMEKTIKSQAEKVEENTKEVERLRKSIGAKEEQEKKHIDAIRQLTNTVKKLEKEVSILQSNLEDSSERELSLKKSLDSTYKDLTELRKSYADKENEVESLKSELEVEARENLMLMLQNANKEAAREKEILLLQITELRNTVSNNEEEASLREKMLKAEIAALQNRLQEAEERNEDLTKNVSSATRPLVRQIENLQATYNAHIISWEKTEANLTDRLRNAQNQLAVLSEKEHSLSEKYLECQTKVTALDAQNSALRQEKLQLSTEFESLKSKIVVLEEKLNKKTCTVETAKQNLNLELSKLKKEKENLHNTMANCLEQLDTEKRKVQKLEEELKLRDVRAAIMSGSSPCPSPTGSVRSSVSSIHNWSQDEVHDQGMHTPVNMYRLSVYESLRLGSGSSLLENLQSQLKQREGENFQLQCEISKLEKLKESMAEELVQLSGKIEELEKQVMNLKSFEEDYKDLNQKYNTLLQMYGEKVEETEELQLDLADVKSMYKAQIEELLVNK
ncbi:TATA element modulatory factor-like [Stegodyphus dumicola]|uniref:TATA element modulatory factor-like n=1 Tax=Stegodyphus dumicola TaxID=202533 RepID=UPI0015B19DE9|nr:TATA element modulatory factor-like [Stegodyphus dumicola]